jgi:tRNA (guanosine-2'-O-)-methyltransferase
VELAEGAELYTDYEWPEKVCLVLGNEVNGVYTSVMKHRDGAVYIPMFGKGRSMNVHVSAAIVAFHIKVSS